MQIILSPDWQAAYPHACIGILAMTDVANPAQHTELDGLKGALEEELRRRYAGYSRSELRAEPRLQAYAEYYRGFRKSYHVRLQLESILKGKSIPSGAALVEAMFMAELDSLLLTAGHDLGQVEPPVRVDVAQGDEEYLTLGEREQTLKAGDMYIADARGILSSILYGPDHRTRLRPETRRALFTVYAPAGIDRQAVEEHLRALRDNVLLVAPAAQTDELRVYCASE